MKRKCSVKKKKLTTFKDSDGGAVTIATASNTSLTINVFGYVQFNCTPEDLEKSDSVFGSQDTVIVVITIKHALNNLLPTLSLRVSRD